MKPGTLPTTPTVAPVRRVTPSFLVSARECPLKATWAANGLRPLLPRMAEAALGSVIHRVMEDTGRGRLGSTGGFAVLWDQQLQKEEGGLSQSWLERHLVPLSSSVRDYEQRKELCRLAVEKVAQYVRPTTTHSGFPPRSSSELWIETPDGVCAGRADLVRRTGDRTDIIDYKSTVIRGSGEGGEAQLPNAFEVQLKFYAALYHSRHREWPTSLQIVANGGQAFGVTFSHEECEALLKGAYVVLARVNCAVRESSKSATGALFRLARPSPSACSRCQYRPVCLPYWDARDRTPSPDWPNDLHGVVVETGRWGREKAFIDMALTGEEDRTVKVVDITPERHPALHQGVSELYTFSLVPYGGSSGVFREGKYTVMYSHWD
ncbi:PD-(D/E)XK nuclease superfamily protein [anaerobic digester metagenome]